MLSAFRVPHDPVARHTVYSSPACHIRTASLPELLPANGLPIRYNSPYRLCKE